MGCAKVLLDHKAAVNSRDAHGNTPLHEAQFSMYESHRDGTTITAKDVLAITKLLLAHGADKKLRNNENHLPINIPKERRRTLQNVSDDSPELEGFQELLQLLEPASTTTIKIKPRVTVWSFRTKKTR